jgi:hypothetical protein
MPVAEARRAKMLTKDEARRIAVKVTRLPEPLGPCGRFSLPLTNITNAAASVGFSSCAAAIGRTFAGSASEEGATG